jgi:ketosteroid isomerase-like protein
MSSTPSTIATDSPANAAGEVVDAFFAAFGSGDSEALLDLYAYPVDFHVAGAPNVPWSGERSTRDELAEFFGTFGKVLSAPESFELTGRIEQGSDAVVFADCVFSVLDTGKKFRNRYALHFSVLDGQITKYHMYEDSYAIHEAFNA